MPSPPFIDYDSDNDKISNSSEWEYDHDDYWDQDEPRQSKGNNAGEYTNENNEEPKKKRRRVVYKKYTTGSSLESHNTTTPTVIWKSKQDLLSIPEGPIVKAGQGDKVALLKDWRERFKYQPNHAALRSEPNPIKRRGSQVATAVLIENSCPESYDSTMLAPTTLKRATGLPSRSKVSPSIPEHKSTVVNGTIPHTSASEPVSGGSNPKRLVRSTAMAGKKRNIEELLNHKENEIPAPKKRLGTPTKKTSNTIQSCKQGFADITNSSIPTSRSRKADDSDDRSVTSPPLASKTNSSIPASRKRKVDDSDDTSIMSPRKRTDTAKTKVVEANTPEGNGSPVRRTTRRIR